MYTETEVADLGTIAGITSILPYGFVVSNPSTSGSRTLPANPGASQFDGLVTFAFKVPLQGSAADDPFTITAMFLPVDDNQAVVTQSFEEADATSVVERRLARHGARRPRPQPRSARGGLHAGDAPVHGPQRRHRRQPDRLPRRLHRPLAPRDPSPYVGAGELHRAPTPASSATFSETMSGAIGLDVRGQQRTRAARRSVSGTYTGAGSTTLDHSVASAFFPGEQVEVSL